ncbi:hypothetical protein EBR21_02895 [bacterium]|nr:hypothetical protein [bacterium]
MVFIFPQSGQAEITRPVDLRIELDPGIYSSALCQKIVRFHEDRSFAPWGMTFSQPSHFCSFPLELSKSYKLHMWRLVVTQSEEVLSFAYCRPKKTSDFMDEDCTARLDLKKRSSLVSQLATDDFLFAVLAFLQEKLPFRDFNLLGENYARPEPRIKSKLLERPPALAKGIVDINSSNGQIQVRPVSKFSDSIPESAVWFVPVESMQGRHSAMDSALQEMGLEKTAPPPAEANLRSKSVTSSASTTSAKPTPAAPSVSPEGSKDTEPFTAKNRVNCHRLHCKKNRNGGQKTNHQDRANELRFLRAK